jgi:hypothetical protein
VKKGTELVTFVVYESEARISGGVEVGVFMLAKIYISYTLMKLLLLILLLLLLLFLKRNTNILEFLFNSFVFLSTSLGFFIPEYLKGSK